MRGMRRGLVWSLVGTLAACTGKDDDTPKDSGDTDRGLSDTDTGSAVSATLASVAISPAQGVHVDTTLTCRGTLEGGVTAGADLEIGWAIASTGTVLGQGATLTLTPQDVSPGDVVVCAGALPGDDTPKTDTVVVEGRPPVVDTIALDPTSALYGDGSVTCVATASDPDGEVPVLSYTWTHVARGEVVGTEALLDLSGAPEPPGSVLRCEATAIDPGGLTASDTAEIPVANRAPALVGPTISPDDDVANDDTLTCAATASDPDGETPSLTYVWYDAATQAILGTGPTLLLDAAPGDRIVCEATATDPSGAIAEAEASIVVGNRLPVLSAPQITPQDPTNDVVVTCAATATDPDGDTPSLAYQWTNGVGGPALGTGSSLTLSPARALPADDVVCTVTATDATGSSVTATTSVSVAGRPPGVDPPVIAPSAPTFNDATLTCTTLAGDPDGEVPTLSLAWRNVTTSQSLGAGSTLVLTPSTAAPGDLIACEATAVDGLGYTGSDTTTRTVANRAPAVDPPTIAPTTPFNDAVLTCAAQALDPDGDALTTGVQWTVVGTGVVLGTGETLTLDPEQVAPGEGVRCTVHTEDPSGATAEAFADVVLGNRAPSVGTVSIAPEGVVHNDSTLVCAATASDPDGESVSLTFAWSRDRDGAALGTGDTLVLDPQQVLPGDTVRCTATATDGASTTGSGEAAVSVANRAPDVPSITLSPEAGLLNDETVTCGVVAGDPDGETPTVAIAWTLQGEDTVMATGASWDLAGAVAPGEVVVCTATATDDAGATSEAQASGVVSNRDPVVGEVVLATDPDAHNDATWTCTASPSDGDGDPLSVVVTWTNTTTDTVLGTSASYTLSAQEASVGDGIACAVEATDPLGASSTAVASGVVVNRPPSVGTPEIQPSTPVNDGTVACAADVSDRDGETPETAVRWLDGEGALLGTGASLDLTGLGLAPGEALGCEVVATDGSGATGSASSSVVVANRAPTVSDVTITHDGAFTVDAVLTCDGAVVDPDGDVPAVAWAWTNGAGTVLGQAAVLDLDTVDVAPFETITCTMTVTDPSGADDSASGSVALVNRPPTVDTPVVGPDPAYNDSVLTCAATAQDADDGVAPTVTYGWSRAGDGAALGTGASLTLSSQTTAPGDVLVCTATATDASGDTASATASIALSNRAPTVDVPQVSSSTAITNDATLTCAATGVDPDGEAVTTSYAWTVEGSPEVVGTAATLVLTPSLVQPGQALRCTVTAEDPGGLQGMATSESATVEGRDPVLGALSITPEDVFSSTQVACRNGEGGLIAASDPDASIDPATLPTLSFVWRVVGDSTVLGTLDVLDLSPAIAPPGATLECVVTATDPQGRTTSGSATTTVGNRPPTLGTPTRTDTSAPHNDSTVSCAVAASDPDGSEVTVTWVWRNRTQDTVIGEDATLVLTPALAAPLDTIRCEASATDAHGGTAGPTVGADVAIVNRDPVVTATLDAGFVLLNDGDVACEASASDPDGGTPTVGIAWVNQTTATTLGEGTPWTLSPETVSPGDTIACVATATDAHGGTASDADADVVVNRTPTVSTPQVDPSESTFNDGVLTCAATGSDPDQLPVSVSYRWIDADLGTELAQGATWSLSSDLVGPGDAVACVATVTDSLNATSLDTSAPVSVDNRPPVVGAPSWSSGAFNDDTWACGATVSDPDGQTPTVVTSWRNLSTSTELAADASSLLLTPSTASPGDTVRCTITATDPSSGTASAFVERQVGNRAPTIAGGEIAPTAPLNDGSATCAAVGVVDPDGETPALSYAWRNTTQDFSLGHVNPLPLNSGDASPGDTLSCVVTATDAGGLTGTATALATVGNRVPTVDTPTLSPSTGVTNDTTITCAAETSDPDATPSSVVVTWSNETQGTSIGADGSLTLTSGTALPGDTIQCAAAATDGTLTSEPKTATVVVANREPVLTDVSITPDSDVTNDTTLHCAVTASDADGEVLTPTYAWHNETTDTPLGTGDSVVLEPASAAPGDTVSCTASVADGMVSSAPASDAVTVVDRAPQLSLVVIAPATDVVNDATLVCGASASDPDGDGVSLAYQWRNLSSGTDLGTAATQVLTSSLAQPGDLVRCAVVATARSLTDSASDAVLIDNRAPTVTVPTLDPSADVFNDTTLACAATGSDADGQATTVSYAWRNATASTDLGTGATLDLTPSNAAPGDQITCRAVANDGVQPSAEQTAGVVVGNRLPSLTEVSVEVVGEGNADSEATLRCDSDASDPDGTALSPSYTWTNLDRSTTLGTGQTLTLTPSVASYGETIQCALSVSDGDAFAGPVADTVVLVPRTFTLTVTHQGTGSGAVLSDVGGVDCDASCAVGIAEDTVLTLAEEADADSVFLGWGGVCSGTSCVLTMSGDRTVTATFDEGVFGDGLVINEVSSAYYTNVPGWIEVSNQSDDPVDLSDYELRTTGRRNTSPYAHVGTVTFQLPALVVPAGEIAVIRARTGDGRDLPDTGLRQVIVSNAGGEVPWWTNSEGFVELLANGSTEDFVRWGTSSVAPTVDGAWGLGAVGSAPSGAEEYGRSIARTGESDRNVPSDWIVVDWATPGGVNDVPYGVADDDEDGIPDSAEVPGGTFAGLDLYGMGARAGVPDIFIEADHMDPSGYTQSDHLGGVPQYESLQLVVDAFAAQGIAVHFDAGTHFSGSFDPSMFNLGQGDSIVPFATAIDYGPDVDAGVEDFYSYKIQHFDPARSGVFHYLLFANTREADGSASNGGAAELLGNDLTLWLGSWSYFERTTTWQTYYTINYQAKVIMHELGHNLDLRHGGDENTNDKPNYHSIMNYMNQYGLGPQTGSGATERYYNAVEIGTYTYACDMTWSVCGPDFVMDFSHGDGDALDESALVESDGLGHGSVWIDYDDDGIVDASPVHVDANRDGIHEVLHDFDDWSHIVLAFARGARGTLGPSPGSRSRPTTDPLTNDRQPVIVEPFFPEIVHR